MLPKAAHGLLPVGEKSNAWGRMAVCPFPARFRTFGEQALDKPPRPQAAQVGQSLCPKLRRFACTKPTLNPAALPNVTQLFALEAGRVGQLNPLADFLHSLERAFIYPLLDLGEFKLTPYVIFKLLLIYLVVRFVLGMVARLVRRHFGESKHVRGNAYSIIQMVKYLAYTLAFIYALDSLGVNITVLLAGSTALFVGLGLGLQDSFRDLASGLILLFEGVVKVGHVVEVDNEVGIVQELGLRTSKVKTRDGQVVIIPNSRLTSNSMVNYSYGTDVSRFHVVVSVAYGSPTDRVRELLLACAAQHPGVAPEPAPTVQFIDFGPSGLVFDLLVWVTDSFRSPATLSDLRFAIDAAFRHEGITIPFPQRDLHLRSGWPPPATHTEDA